MPTSIPTQTPSTNGQSETIKKNETGEVQNSAMPKQGADKSNSVQMASEHKKGARGSTYDKHTARRSGKSYGESRNNNRGDKNKKYQKSPNPNKKKK